MESHLTRRQMLRLTAGAAAGALLAACGGTPTPTQAPPTATPKPAAATATPAPAAKTPSTITIWSQASLDPMVAAWKKIVADFEAATPDTKVDYQFVSYADAPTKVPAGIAAGTPPNLTYIYAHGVYIQQGVEGSVLPVNDVIQELGGEKAFFAPAIVLQLWQGNYYAVPISIGPDVTFYRKDLFEQKGIAVPDTTSKYSLTWDEYYDAAMKLNDPPNRYGMVQCLLPPHGEKFQWGLMMSNGATMFDKDGKVAFNTPETVETYDFAGRLFKNAGPAGIATYALADADGAYTAGKAAMYTRASGFVTALIAQAPDILAKTGFLPPPMKKERGSYMGAPGLVVYKHKEADRAKRFVSFFMRKENQIAYCLSSPSGALPATTAVAQDPAYLNAPALAQFKSVIDIAVKTLPTAFSSAQRYGSNPKVGAVMSKQVLENTLVKILTKGMTAAQAVAEGEKEALEAIK